MAVDLKSLSQGQVTIEDATDDDDFDLDDADELVVPSASSSAAVANGPDNTNRGGLSPGVESQFEVWLRNYVNQPLLDHVVPEWVTPNAISFFNTGVCWTAFLFGYIAYKYGEHTTQAEAFASLRSTQLGTL
jgi:hypothetical protein